MPYCVDWQAGPTSQIELFAPLDAQQAPYQLKYTPAFRATIRPPIEACNLSANDLMLIGQDLDRLAAQVQGRSPAAGGGAPPGSTTGATMTLLGNMLLELTVPPYAMADLRPGGQFVEIGMDESLLGYPWELMHDGEEFFCLKHALGRFVNSATRAGALTAAPANPFSTFSDLSVLLVSVPAPQPRSGREFERLPGADAETMAIATTLTRIPGVKLTVLSGRDATWAGLFTALKGGHQILHFCGHAYFDDEHPRSSGLVLHDRDMSTGAIVGFLTKSRPIFCFINGCESARIGVGVPEEWKNQYNIYSLARAFLDTGAYLLGSRWKVNDQAARSFAESFYQSLLGDTIPIGRAVQKARQDCVKLTGDPFGWASYILYGDPRVCFQQRPG
jgi:hypothetical protein